MPNAPRLRELQILELALRRGVLEPGLVARALSGGASSADGTLARLRALRPELAATLDRLAAEVEATGFDASPQGPAEETAERYIEFFPVGEGGMGIVYMALDTRMHRFVAVKLARPDEEATSEADPLALTPPEEGTSASKAFEQLRRRILHEAWVTAGLEHPGIVPVYELGETPQGIPYYTMRLLDGQRTLRTALQEAGDLAADERLPLLEPLLRVCDTVAYAHSRGVVHRDIKPDNVALGEFGEVLLLDWGLAKFREGSTDGEDPWQEQVVRFRELEEMRTIAEMLGTPGYMAPEAALGRSEEVDESSDVYSLGVLLFEILTGRRPFQPRTWAEYVDAVGRKEAPDARLVDPGVPPALAELCAQTLRRDRTRRLGNAASLAEAIRRWQTESAQDREVQGRKLESRACLDRALDLTGKAALTEVDQAVAFLLPIREKRPKDPAVEALLEEAEDLRRRVQVERERDGLRRARRRGGVRAAVLFLLLALLGLGGVHLVGVVRDWSRQRERDRHESAAASALAATEQLPAEKAIEGLARVIEAYPSTAAQAPARRRRAERFAEVGRRERAQGALAETWVHHPASVHGQRAGLRLACEFAEEGRLVQAGETVRAVQAYATEDRLRAEALLLEAEVAWGLDRGAAAHDALDALEALEQELPGSLHARAEAFRQVNACYQPITRIERPGLLRGQTGRFRASGTWVAITRMTGEASLHHVTAAGIEAESRLEWSEPGPPNWPHAADLDGDGIDELIYVTMGALPIEQATDQRESLRIMDLSGGEAVCLAEVEVPHASFGISAGDLDGDGDVDLLLGLGYPMRGVILLRRLDGHPMRFEPVPHAELGDLNLVSEGNSDIQTTAVADVTGDGRMEAIVCAEQFGLLDLLVFVHDPAIGTYREIPVEAAAAGPHLGLVRSCVVRPSPLRDQEEIVFVLRAEIWPEVLRRGQEFLPLGLHAASYEPVDGTLAVRPLRTGPRLELEPRGPGDPPPTNCGGTSVGRLRLRPGGADLVVTGRTRRGARASCDWLQIHPEELPGVRPFTRRLPSASPGVVVCKHGILLAFNADPSLLMLGRADFAPREGPTRAQVIQPRRRTTVERRVDLGSRLTAMGFHRLAEEQFREALEADAPSSIRREAHRGLVSALAYQGRYDECTRLLRERKRRGTATRRERLWLAQYLERSQRWPDAAREYVELADLGGLSEAELAQVRQKVQDLEPWVRVSERRIDPFTAARATRPGQFRILESGVIRARDMVGANTHLEFADTVGAGSFELSLELRVDALTFGHLLQFGFLSDEDGGWDLAPGLTGWVTTDSEAENQIRIAVDQTRPVHTGLQRITVLKEGTPYRCVLAWNAPTRRLGLAIWSAHEATLIYSAQVIVDGGLAVERLPLGLRLAGGGRPGWTDVQVRNLILRRPAGAPDPVASRRVAGLSRAHAAWAASRRDEAARTYEQVQASPAASELDRRQASIYLAFLRFLELDDPGRADAAAALGGSLATPDAVLLLLPSCACALDAPPAARRALAETLFSMGAAAHARRPTRRHCAIVFTAAHLVDGGIDALLQSGEGELDPEVEKSLRRCLGRARGPSSRPGTDDE